MAVLEVVIKNVLSTEDMEYLEDAVAEILKTMGIQGNITNNVTGNEIQIENKIHSKEMNINKYLQKIILAPEGKIYVVVATYSGVVNDVLLYTKERKATAKQKELKTQADENNDDISKWSGIDSLSRCGDNLLDPRFLKKMAKADPL